MMVVKPLTLINPMPFTYDTNAVTKVNFDAHIKLYNSYADKLNEADASLRQGVTDAQFFTGVKEAETYSLDGLILHEEYFRSMTAASCAPGERAQKIIARNFGCYDNFVKNLEKTANAARGWCVFAYEQRTNDFRFLLQDAHDQGVVTLSLPIITCDVYEHAYYLDYKTDKAGYIAAFVKSINWKYVEDKLTALNLS